MRLNAYNTILLLPLLSSTKSKNKRQKERDEKNNKVRLNKYKHISSEAIGQKQ